MSTNESARARSSGSAYGQQLRGSIEAATEVEVVYQLMQEAVETAQRLRAERGVDYFTAWRTGLLESFPEGFGEMAEV